MCRHSPVTPKHYVPVASEGRACVHPRQVAVSNTVWSTSEVARQRARSVMAEFAEKTRAGVGAFRGPDGKMIDHAPFDGSNRCSRTATDDGLAQHGRWDAPCPPSAGQGSRARSSTRLNAMDHNRGRGHRAIPGHGEDLALNDVAAPGVERPKGLTSRPAPSQPSLPGPRLIPGQDKRGPPEHTARVGKTRIDTLDAEA